jgi:hypothetical protein
MQVQGKTETACSTSEALDRRRGTKTVCVQSLDRAGASTGTLSPKACETTFANQVFAGSLVP